MIDKAQGRVTKFYDFRLFSIPKSFDLSHVSLITITWEDLPASRTRPVPVMIIFNVNMLRPKDHQVDHGRVLQTRSRKRQISPASFPSALGIPVKDLSDTEPDEDCDPKDAGYGYAVKSAASGCFAR